MYNLDKLRSALSVAKPGTFFKDARSCLIYNKLKKNHRVSKRLILVDRYGYLYVNEDAIGAHSHCNNVNSYSDKVGENG